MNGKADIHFRNGTKVKEVEDATYLGAKLNNRACREAELNSRFSKALATCGKLNIFWRKQTAPSNGNYKYITQ